MAQLAVSAVGAAIGFAVGGPAGAQWGWMAGSLIGAMAFGEKSQGPRLDDTKVQISSYGVAIPLPYGGVRVAGNVIWSTDLQESSSESGGKGGTSVETFSYSVSCAVAIAGREIGGIRRVWADAKLVYDAREDADSATQAASTAFAEYMTVYLGTETQLPDPTIEAAEGAGNVEAYRGVAYVVFTDLPLGDYGNRIPNFSFEVTTETPVEDQATLLEPLRVYDWTLDGEGRPVHAYGDTLYRTNYGGVVTGTDLSTVVAANIDGYETELRPGYPTASYSTDWIGLYSTGVAFFSYSKDNSDLLGVNPEVVVYWTGDIDNVWEIDDGYNFNTFDNTLEIPAEFKAFATLSGNAHIGIRSQEEFMVTPPDLSGEPPFINNGGSGVADEEGPPYTFSRFNFYPLVPLDAERVPTHAAKSCYPGNPCSNAEGAAELPGNGDFCLTCEGEVTPNYEWTIVNSTAKILCDVEYRSGVLYQNALGPVLLPGDPNYSNAAYWTAAKDAAVAAGTMESDVTYPVVVSSYASGEAPTALAVGEGSALLSDIVTDVCLRAGLTEDDIDVSQLVDEVQGFTISRQMPARSAIEPLRQAFFFDAVENGEQIVFVKRGGASAVTISAGELGASESGDSPVLTIPRRAQETELPATIDVAYMVRAADYQTGTQSARRVTTGSQQITSLQLPIVMTDDYAAQVADVLMMEAWQGRVEREFTTTRKYTKYLPTNIFTVDDGDFQYRGRVTEKTEEGPLIRWKMRDDATSTYSPSVTASPTSGGGSAIRFVGPMAVELMDLPALRDDDDNAGFYAAAFSYIGSFRGGVLYKSNDDTNYTALQEMRVSATVGHATTTLGDFYGGNVFDEINSVTVVLSSGSLSSVTRGEVLNGSNAALLGDEIIQFRTATLTGTNTYRLSGLLRGRRGTEAATFGHMSTDRFVLLNEATIYRVSQSLAQLGAAYYRPVAYGGSVSLAGTEEFTNTGAALKPLSPAHMNVSVNTDGDFVVTWKRRTRIGGAWLDNIDAPLSEASESYRVRLLDITGTALEEQTVSVQTATLGADSDAYSVEVVQLSATVGAGDPATFIL